MDIRLNTISETDLYNHFIVCNTRIECIDLKVHSAKLRKYAVTIEAWKENELVGLCACYMNNFETKIAYITHIAVHPEYKHQGCGRKIMEATIAEAKSKGFNKIQLEVHKDNSTAIALYKNFGFSMLEDREAKYLMEKSI